MKAKNQFLLLLIFTILISSSPALGAVIKGTVLDSGTDEPLISANVTVDGTNSGASTDLSGRYVIMAVEPGVYTIRASMIGYNEQVKEDVVVYDNDELTVDFKLKSTAIKLEESEVVGSAKKGAEKREIEERFKAMTITDALAGEELKRMPDPDVAHVVRRATGVSTAGGDPIIRGLGVRYSKVTLNSSAIAGTEPNTSGVSLELFPASMMSRVTVNKSYMADQFGEFGGGVINMNTWEIPKNSEVSVSVSLGYNPKSTFTEGYSYEGGSFDFFGFDDGSRDMPDEIANSESKITKRGRFTQIGYTAEELETMAESFDNNWAAKEFTATPNQSYSVSYTSSAKLFNRDLGYMISGLFKHSNNYKEVDRNIFKGGSGDKIELQHEYNFKHYTEAITFGGMAAFRYELSKLHRLSLNTFVNRDVENETRFFTGYNGDRSKNIEDTRLKFLAQTVMSSQISGKHFFAPLNRSSLEWQFTYSNGRRDEPDMREIQYEKDPHDEHFVLADENQSGSRIFNDLSDNSYNFGLDWTTPATKQLKFKTGYNGLVRERDSESRFFQFEHKGSDVDKSEGPDSVFRAENIGANGFEIREATRPTDAYTAEHRLHAGYLISDWQIVPKLRLIGGVRYEYSKQKLTTYELFTSTQTPVVGQIKTDDILPALNVVFNFVPSMNLRLALSQTVSRPDFRELSPFEFTDIIGGHAEIGNPELKRALVQHADVRYEWTHGSANLAAFSLFYKYFDNPIETVIQPTAQHRISYENAESADNYGLEIELRQKLGDLFPRLSPWAISTNLTLLESDIQLSDTTKGIQTSDERPLHGQSPYLFNFSLTYTDYHYKTNANLFFHIFGKRISEVGSKPLPDIYELPHPDLDLVINQPLNEHFSLKAAWKNILDPEVRFRQGDKYTEAYKVGSTYSIGLSYRN